MPSFSIVPLTRSRNAFISAAGRAVDGVGDPAPRQAANATLAAAAAAIAIARPSRPHLFGVSTRPPFTDNLHANVPSLSTPDYSVACEVHMRIGLDLGGTKIEAVALGADGQELVRRRVSTPREYHATLAAMADLVRDVERQTG